MTTFASDGFHGRAKRVTITLPEDLEAAIKAEIGEREFSSYVAEAAARRYQQDQLAGFLDELDAEHGPVPEQVRREVASWWPDADETR
ncbi:MAG TPA: hypothetical protein VFX70_02330 [Mycobacteriales bacterium]|nr:hypothetical protein [Mycobacteriales bacterium]